MTTLAELKTQAASLLSDPDMQTFSSADLGYFINSGIAELSRLAPQRFVEDIPILAGTTTYPVHGGDGNLVANPSFEQGDETMFDGSYNTIAPGDEELTGGWSPSTTLRALWSRSTNAKHGLYAGTLRPAAAVASHYLYQDIPVNPGTTYNVSGWHWKSVAGGRSNIVRFHTLDDSSVVVTTDAVRHDTTAGTPQQFSGSIEVPDDGTVAYIRVILLAFTESLNTSSEVFAFDSITVTEYGQGRLVATNSLDQIELVRVELWSQSYDPARFITTLSPIHQSPVSHSEAGWQYWGGELRIPYRIVSNLDEAVDYLKVWGYAPYDKLTSATQTTDLSFELEQALMKWVRMEGLEKLVFSRDLYTQWQTRSGNTDVSPASLMNSLSMARDDWRRVSRQLGVLREGQN